ncbi:hypothetical protein D3C85_678860 [compost metagenome]
MPPALSSARHGVGQIRRLVQWQQVLAPEAFAGVGVLLLQPVDIAPVRHRLGQCLTRIVAEHLTDQPGTAPAVDQEVVIGPDQLIAVVTQAHQHQALQGWTVEVETLGPLTVGQCLQGLGRGVLPAPVEQADGQGHIGQHKLQGLSQVLPQEAGAQNVVTLAHRLPRGLEAQRLQALHRDTQLVDIEVDVRRVQTEEQHALLHR